MTTATRRRHGWQRPLHPLQIVGMAVFSFYIFLGLLLGSGAAEITVTTIFSFVIRWIRPVTERRREAPKRWCSRTFVPIPQACSSNFDA
ncbi:protein S-acyltransferase 18-like isoform X3 [Eucalyptus grandis]|uniref:protein S-acyltransferase 18-like isoform X3 n=1 Tax=Eucalyptus grandis TaxID=71139 RepID=UPI00192F09F5|nr:protein S-acyltransferase 18-like isoform X3 [Eucalyptus grandis]